MELRQLRWMLVVAEELHFGRAAARLHVTASALSQQVARLEREIGVVLFERSPRHVRLTGAGAVLVAQIRPVLLGIERAVIAAQAVASGTGRIVVGFTSHGAGNVMAVLVQQYAQRFPHVVVELRELDFGAHFTALERGVVDAQFVQLPVPAVNGVRMRLLATEPRVVAVGRHHRLSRGHGPVTVDDLRAQTFFRLPPQVPRAWLDHFAPWGVADDAPRVATAGEALTLAAAGHGVVLLPQSLARSRQHVDVVYRPAPVDPSRLAIAWRCQHNPPPPSRAEVDGDEIRAAPACAMTDAFADMAAALVARRPDLLGFASGV